MIVDYSAEIKIAIFQSLSKRQRDEWRSSNCGRMAAKIERFNSVNSEITGQKFTKFGHFLLIVKLEYLAVYGCASMGSQNFLGDATPQNP